MDIHVHVRVRLVQHGNWYRRESVNTVPPNLFHGCANMYRLLVRSEYQRLFFNVMFVVGRLWCIRYVFHVHLFVLRCVRRCVCVCL